MTTHKLGATDAFIVFDLDGASRNLGVTRLAPKILVDGAELLARSVTYLCASFERKAGGASAGINARPDTRDDAVAAFVAEVKPLVEAGTFTTEAGRGLRPADLAPLTEATALPFPTGERRDAVAVAGVVAAAGQALGGLDGRTVAIEAWDQAPRALAPALEAQGASVVAVSGAGGAVIAPGGIDTAILAGGGADLAAAGEVQPAPAVWAAAADALLAGSKAGVLDHTVAGSVQARAVVPWGPVPVTAKALAALRRGGVAVLPDFVTTAGPTLVALSATGEDRRSGSGVGAVAGADPAAVASVVTAVLDEVADHPDGPLLGACHRAEVYLRTWRDHLPFGRPIA